MKLIKIIELLFEKEMPLSKVVMVFNGKIIVLALVGMLNDKSYLHKL